MTDTQLAPSMLDQVASAWNGMLAIDGTFLDRDQVRAMLVEVVRIAPPLSRTRIVWTDERREQLIRRKAAGEPSKAVGLSLGITASAVDSHLCVLRKEPRWAKLYDESHAQAAAPQRDDSWSEEEKAVVRAGYAEGITRRQIQERLPDPSRRSVSAIGYVANEMGLRKGARLWTDADKQQLRDLVAEGKSRQACAATLGRTVPSINTMASEIGVSWGHAWSEDDYATLRRHHAEGRRLTEAAEALGRPYYGVAKMAEKMGLSFKRVSQAQVRRGTRPETALRARPAPAAARQPDNQPAPAVAAEPATEPVVEPAAEPVPMPAPAAAPVPKKAAAPAPIEAAKPVPVIDPEAPVAWTDELDELIVRHRAANVVYQQIHEETGVPIHALAQRWATLRTERRWQRLIAELTPTKGAKR